MSGDRDADFVNAMLGDPAAPENPMTAIFDLAAFCIGWSVIALPAARDMSEALWHKSREMPPEAVTLLSMWADARMAHEKRMGKPGRQR